MGRYNPRSKPPTKAQQQWLDLVAQQKCVVTGRRDIQLHHIVECKRRFGHDYVLPLSVETHRDIYKIPVSEQMELCKALWADLGREWVSPPSKIVKRGEI